MDHTPRSVKSRLAVETAIENSQRRGRWEQTKCDIPKWDRAAHSLASAPNAKPRGLTP